MTELPEINPKAFLHIDLLTKILMDALNEAGNDFDMKIKAIREQELACLRNEKQLESIGKFVGTMKDCVQRTELELHENEENLLEMEKLVSRYEASYKDFARGHQLIHLKPHSSYIAFLQLLMSADRSSAQCLKLKAELEDYNKEAIKQLDCSRLITRIMDYHVKALNALDKQLNTLATQTQKVTKSYDEIVKQRKIRSLCIKCNCHMADIVDDKYVK